MYWGYNTYALQPQWFLDILHIVNMIDIEYEKRSQQIANRKR